MLACRGGLTLAMVACAACGPDANQPRYIAAQDVRSDVLCRALKTLPDSSPISDLSTVDDTSFAVLYDQDRLLAIYNSTFERTAALTFDRDGARGVLHPVSAAVTDSLIYIADDGRSVIRYFDRRGRDRGTLHLRFMPRRIRAGGGDVVVAPLVAGGSPGHLLFRVQNQQVVPLGGSIARYDDLGLNTLANMTSLAAFPGRFVVMHELVVPFGYVIRPSSAVASTRRIALPVPASERARISRVPAERITEKNVNELGVIAFAATESRANGHSFYVTRTGDGKRHPFRKIVVQLDSLMQLQRVFGIDVHPHHLAYLHDRASLIAVDAEDKWFECPLP
ncbi:MAG TPA: hypothetical protein VFO52_15240 [Longimicrobiales bacterium]|nr:hypothetical protein [Longimicrobiales bacterium]